LRRDQQGRAAGSPHLGRDQNRGLHPRWRASHHLPTPRDDRHVLRPSDRPERHAHEDRRPESLRRRHRDSPAHRFKRWLRRSARLQVLRWLQARRRAGLDHLERHDGRHHQHARHDDRDLRQTNRAPRLARPHQDPIVHEDVRHPRVHDVPRHIRARSAETSHGPPGYTTLWGTTLLASLTTLRRRRGGGGELLAYRAGRTRVDVSTADINGYLKELLGPAASAKDLRTSRGTVLAAAALARAPQAGTARRRQAAVRAAVRLVAADLGNTPAVSRASYIDPQVIDAFERGETIPADAATPGEVEVRSGLAPAERAVLELLG